MLCVYAMLFAFFFLFTFLCVNGFSNKMRRIVFESVKWNVGGNYKVTDVNG